MGRDAVEFGADRGALFRGQGRRDARQGSLQPVDDEAGLQGDGVGEQGARPDSLAARKQGGQCTTGKLCRLYSVGASYLDLMSCSPAIVTIILLRRRSMATITKTFGWM